MACSELLKAICALLEQLERFMANGGEAGEAGRRTVIVKPENGSKGKGIFITQHVEDIPRSHPVGL